jgi:hypothetical protein
MKIPERPNGTRVNGRGASALDFVLLAGAILAGVWIAREWFSNHSDMTFYVWSALLSLTLLPVSVAIFFIRLRRPRPPIARIARQPGFQMGVAVCLAVVEGVIARRILEWRHATPQMMPLSARLTIGSLYVVGPLIATLWATLALSGCWRPEQSWIDRLGRLLGWLWLSGYTIVTMYILSGHRPP